MDAKKLERPKKGRMLFGVAAGIANYFNIDATIVRIIFIIITIWGGVGIVLYIVGIFLIPEEGAKDNKEKNKEKKIEEKVESIASEIKQTVKERKIHRNGGWTFGLIVLLIGIIFLLSNFVWWFSWSKMWPIILIVIGLIIIASGQRGKS